MSKPILWTHEAEIDIDEIYEYYFEKSPLAASRIINDIITSAESLVFSDQYQIEDYKTNCRRIIIRNYKVLYTYHDEFIYILRVFDTRQNPVNM